ITYLTDIVFDPSNEKKAISLAKDSDHLFIEAAFLDKDREIAHKKHHLTAYQAGYIAGKSKAREFTLFHHSPRNMGLLHEIQNEAQQGFNNATAGDSFESS
ncbi:MAG: ribonuclease Z, partial [Thermodesulfobacteriota bacterium]